MSESDWVSVPNLNVQSESDWVSVPNLAKESSQDQKSDPRESWSFADKANYILGVDDPKNYKPPTTPEEALALDPGAAENAMALAGAVVGNSPGDAIAKKIAQSELAKRVGGYFSSAGDKIGNTIKEFASEKAAKALGATKAMLKGGNRDKLLAAGRTGLDEGVVTPLAGTQKMISRAEAMKDRGGKMMGEVYDKIDEAGASTFSPREVAGNLEGELGGFYRSPINRGITRQLDNTIDSVMMRNVSDVEAVPLRIAHGLKEEVGTVANWKNKLLVSPKEQMARESYGIINKAIDDAADAGAQALGTPGLKESLQHGKRLSGHGNEALGLLDDRYAREAGNKFFGLTDVIAGAGATGYGTATGDWEKALAFMALKKGGEKYGNQILSKGSDKVAKMLIQSSPKLANLSQVNPTAFKALVAGVGKKLKISESVPAAAENDKKLKSPREAQDKFIEGN